MTPWITFTVFEFLITTCSRLFVKEVNCEIMLYNLKAQCVFLNKVQHFYKNGFLQQITQFIYTIRGGNFFYKHRNNSTVEKMTT